MSQPQLQAQAGPSQGGHRQPEPREPFAHIRDVIETTLNIPAVAVARLSTPSAGAQPSSDAIPEVVVLETSKRIIKDELYPALSQQARWNKGKGEAVFLRAELDGKDPLAWLDPTQHSLTYLFILSARLKRAAAGSDVAPIQAHELFIQIFCATFDPNQCLLAPERMHTLATALARSSRVLNAPAWPLQPLANIVSNYPAHPSHLTAAHPIFLYQCLLAEKYQFAYDVALRFDIQHAARKAYSLMFGDVLEYFYYGGLILTKLGRFDRATQFFESCITAPSHLLSAIQLDAIKKRLLVQLLKDGKASDLPEYTSERVKTGVRSLLDPYKQFARAYESRRGADFIEGLGQSVAVGADVFREDCNEGLIKQCLLLHRKRRIQRYSQMFSVISLQELHNLLSVGDSFTLDVLKTELSEATAFGWVNARLVEVPDAPSPYIYFDPIASAQTFVDSAATTQRLLQTMEEVQHWQNRVIEQERKLAKSDTFLTKLARQNRPDPRAPGFGTATADGDEVDEESVFAP